MLVLTTRTMSSQDTVQAAITAREVSHAYEARDRRLQALANVSLEVRGGSFVSLIGPSGCGKTTLLRALGGLLEPTGGRVDINGRPPSEARRRKAVGFVFQDPSLLPWRTVFGNVRLSLELNGGGGADDSHKVEEVLRAVQLEDFHEFYPHELSGGMRQRVAMARAMVTDPEVLLMDEPFGALDEITRAGMMYELLDLWQRSPKTVMFVTHSISEAVLLSDRVLVMSSQPGEIIDDILIDIPRPRSEAQERSEQFLDYTFRIKNALRDGAVGAQAS